MFVKNVLFNNCNVNDVKWPNDYIIYLHPLDFLGEKFYLTVYCQFWPNPNQRGLPISEAYEVRHCIFFLLMPKLQYVKGQLNSEEGTNCPFHMHEFTDTHNWLATGQRVRPFLPHTEHNQINSFRLMAMDGYSTVVIWTCNFPMTGWKFYGCVIQKAYIL